MGAETAIALGIAGAITGGAGAMSANSGIRKSERAAVDAARTERTQIKAQRDLEREKRALELDRVRSRQRVLAANAGQSIDGSFGLLMDQAALDAGINQRIADANYAARSARVQSQFDAQFISLENGRQSPLFAAIQGGIQGAMAGHSIGNFFGGGGGAGFGGIGSQPLTIGDIQPIETGWTQPF